MSVVFATLFSMDFHTQPGLALPSRVFCMPVLIPCLLPHRTWLQLFLEVQPDLQRAITGTGEATHVQRALR